MAARTVLGAGGGCRSQAAAAGCGRGAASTGVGGKGQGRGGEASIYTAADGVAGESGTGSEVRVQVHRRARLQGTADARRTLVPWPRKDDELQAGEVGDTADGRRAGGDGESIPGDEQLAGRTDQREDSRLVVVERCDGGTGVEIARETQNLCNTEERR